MRMISIARYTMSSITNKEALQAIIDSLKPIIKQIDKYNIDYQGIHLDLNYDLEKVEENLKRLKEVL